MRLNIVLRYIGLILLLNAALLLLSACVSLLNGMDTAFYPLLQSFLLTAILGALEPLTAVFFGVTVFGESLTLRLCCGIILIILAVTLIIAGSNVTSHLVRFRKLFPRLPLKKKNAKS